MTPLLVLAAMHCLALGAAFLAPYAPAEQTRSRPFAAPDRLRWVDERGEIYLRPFAYAGDPSSATGDGEKRRHRLRLLVRGTPYRVLGPFRSDLHLFGFDGPQRIFLLGSDGLGRDLLSRLLFGARVSLFAGLIATALSLTLGTVVGAVAGLRGGWVDGLAMRLCELFYALPWLYLLLAVRAFLPLDLPPTRAFLLVVLVVGLVGWAKPARLVRGAVLAAREQGYVKAAEGLGAPARHLLRVHVLPQIMAILWTQAAILAPRFILAEVTLSFLGLGMTEPVASWGNLLAALQRYHVLVSYWWMFVPAAALVVVVAWYQWLARALVASGVAGGRVGAPLDGSQTA